jgi:hypothetical protein
MPTPSSYDELPWWQEAGPTVFSPFPDASDYFGDSKQLWMVNFRIRDLDAMAAQLRATGIAIEVDPQHYPNGRFARLHDPEGNPIELCGSRQGQARRCRRLHAPRRPAVNSCNPPSSKHSLRRLRVA